VNQRVVGWLGIYLVWIGVLSCVTLAVYGWDKWQARRGGWRVSERTLHRLSFLGGWPGAWLGQTWFRHKTSKASFQRVFWLAPAIHFTLILLTWYMFARA
jgi:uncharacterized membrane protein YsdA (DUF1294 family)